MSFRIEDFDVKKFDSILARGLCFGPGTPDKQVCIEAAVCLTLGLPHGDDPKCVARAVRAFKIALNDSLWSSSEARSAGLRDLGLAQLGSLGVIDDGTFRLSVGKKTIQRIVAPLFRELYPNDPYVLKAADECEREGSRESALEIRRYVPAASSAASSAAAAYADASATAAYAAAYASASAYVEHPDKYLLISAGLALETLRELNSPGVALLDKEGVK